MIGVYRILVVLNEFSDTEILCVKVNPMGGGKAGNRQEFDVKSIPLVEGLIEYTCPGDGAIDFFSREAESDS